VVPGLPAGVLGGAAAGSFLRAGPGARLAEWLARLLVRPGAILLPPLPLAAVEVGLGSEVGHGVWNHGSYALFLIYGYLAAAEPGIAEAFQRQWRSAATLGLLLFLAAAVAYATADAARVEPFTDLDPLAMSFRLLKSIDGWLWVVAIVGAARAHVQRRQGEAAVTGRDQPDRASLLRRLGAYANDAVLPFYILHEPVIVTVAYVVLAWPVSDGTQYCVIALVSLTATLLLYDLGVRRNPITRFLFGLKPMGGRNTRTPI
jgi:hypothetical protein